LTQHTFMLDHGGEGQLACETCHAASYTAYTCETCHTSADMDAAHVAENIVTGGDSATALGQCSECHPTGQPGEGKAARATNDSSN
jgi:hypothetical protein